MKISFKSGFYRLWIVFAALWVSIGSCLLVSSGLNLEGLLGVILPPPAMLAFGATFSWVLNGFVKQKKYSDPRAERTVTPAVIAFLNEALQWVYLQMVQDLRNDGCELNPSAMPGDMRSAFVQYLFGATLAAEEDLEGAQGAYEWAIEARLQVLRWIIVPVDEELALREGHRMQGLEKNDFAVFALLGAGAMRDVINNSSDMSAWMEAYKGSFLSAARLYTNYR